MRAMPMEVRFLVDYWPVWSYLSNQDLKSRFRRSRLGVMWIAAQQLAFSLGAGYIWAAVFGLSPGEFIPFITLGLAIWGFLAAVMTEGCVAFVVAHGYLKQLPLPQSIFIFRTVLTQIFYFSIGLLTALAVLFAFGRFNLLGLLYCLPGLLLIFAYAYGAVGVMAYLGLRYRDLPHGLAGLFSIPFVVTPVIYPPEVLIVKGLQLFVYGNPFASLMEVVRRPLLHGELASLPHYLIASGVCFALIAARFILARKWTRFVPFWS